MESRGVCMVSVAVMVLAMAAMAPEAAAQATVPDCASKLIDCAQFISTTGTPPATCCNSITQLVEKELPCLCGLLNNTAIINAFNINVTQALGVPRRCGISAGTGLCNLGTSPTTTSAKGPSAPPATPGGDKGAAVGVRMGASTLVALVFFCWFLFA